MKPLTRPPQTTVFDAVSAMSERNSGSVIFIEKDEKVIGVVAERDVMNKLVGKGQDAKTTKRSDIMTDNPRLARETDDMVDRLRIMSNVRFRRLPVADELHLAASDVSDEICCDSHGHKGPVTVSDRWRQCAPVGDHGDGRWRRSGRPLLPVSACCKTSQHQAGTISDGQPSYLSKAFSSWGRKRCSKSLPTSGPAKRNRILPSASRIKVSGGAVTPQSMAVRP